MRPRVTDATSNRAFDDLQQVAARLGATPASAIGRLRMVPKSYAQSFSVSSDDVMVVYTGPGGHSAQLPRSAGRAETQAVFIVNAGGSAITARVVSGELIDGATSQSLANQRAHLFLSDGRGGWYHWGS